MRSLIRLQSKLLSFEVIYKTQSKRHYRFGNSVKNNGFYYSPKHELNKQFMKTDWELRDNKLSAEELRQIRNRLFDREKQRQKDLVVRIEKFEVSVINPYSNDEKQTINLLMNRFISTPHHCSQHINRLITDRSVLALIDDKTYWDMNRPLISDCTLRFKHFKEPNPYFVNKTFWKSCSLMMGSVIERAFKDEIKVNLHSFPKPDLSSGSFVYDVYIGLDNWKPKAEELRVFTAMLQKLISEDIPFERLDVKKELAKEIFEYNDIKRQQIDSIAGSNGSDEVTLYRIRDHIDISCGPMIANTAQVGTICVTAIHPLQTRLGQIYRFQGIAIPKQLNINSFTLSILRERAQKLNSTQFLDNISDQILKDTEMDSKINESVN